VTAAFLLFSVAALTFRARYRRGYGPAVAGIVAAAFVLVGKFYIESTASMYAGLALLVAASLWNTWPQRPLNSGPQRAADGNELIQPSVKEK
ncbi:MAG: MerC domain-containing protein, partial [Acidobacteriota bacterium]|nr:MerC domain-containing protein [Acidobacteriota bacterium]